MICPYCKEIIQEGALKCRFCHSKLTFDPDNTINIENISTDEIRAFVGTNSYYYIQKFSNFTKSGREQFCATWNWSCFGFTFLWMLYRKMYMLALITFVIFCIPGINFFMHIGAGIFGNYLYYRHVKEKILEIRTTQSPQYYFPVLEEMGGVNKWVVTGGIIISIIMFILFIMFFATITTFMEHSITRTTI